MEMQMTRPESASNVQRAHANSKPQGRGLWNEVVVYAFGHAIVGVIGLTYFSVLLGALSRVVFGRSVGDHLFGGPVYPGQILLGFATGLLMNRRLHSKSAAFTWIVGVVLLLLGIWMRVSLRKQEQLRFGPHSRNYQPLYALVPFYISIAYSIGGWLAQRWPARSAGSVARIPATPEN
jgi:hypothetical protein